MTSTHHASHSEQQPWPDKKIKNWQSHNTDFQKWMKLVNNSCKTCKSLQKNGLPGPAWLTLGEVQEIHLRKIRPEKWLHSCTSNCWWWRRWRIKTTHQLFWRCRMFVRKAQLSPHGCNSFPILTRYHYCWQNLQWNSAHKKSQNIHDMHRL